MKTLYLPCVFLTKILAILLIFSNVALADGTVKVSWAASGDLKINGDGDDNGVVVIALDGILTVEGTDLNGQTNIQVGSRVLSEASFDIDLVSDIIVNLKGGDDTLRVGDGNPIDIDGDLRITGAKGDDDIRIDDVIIGGDMKITGGGGEDLVIILDSSGESLDVNLGSQDDDLRVCDSVFVEEPSLNGGSEDAIDSLVHDIVGLPVINFEDIFVKIAP